MESLLKRDDFFGLVTYEARSLPMVSLKIKPGLKGFGPALRLPPGGRIGPQPTKASGPEPNPSIFQGKGINPMKFMVKTPSGFCL